MKRSFGQTSQPPSSAPPQPTIQPPPPPPGAPANYYQTAPLPPGAPPPPPTNGAAANPYAAYGYAAGYGMPIQQAGPQQPGQPQTAPNPYANYGYGAAAAPAAQYNAYAAYSQPQPTPGTPTYPQQPPIASTTTPNPYAAYQQQAYAQQYPQPPYPQPPPPNPYAQQTAPMTPQPQPSYPAGPPPINRPQQQPPQQFPQQQQQQQQFPNPSPQGPPPPKRTRYDQQQQQQQQQPILPAVGGGGGRGGRGGRGGGMSGRGGYGGGGGDHSFNPSTSGMTNLTGPMSQPPYPSNSPSGPSGGPSGMRNSLPNRPSGLPPTPQYPRGGGNLPSGPHSNNAPYGPSSSSRGGGGRGGRGGGGRPVVGLPGGPRAGGGMGGGRRDGGPVGGGFDNIPNAPKGPKASSSSSGGRGYRNHRDREREREDRDSNNKAIGKERKWGEKVVSRDRDGREKERDGGREEERKRTLTDFRISALEIGEIEWEWRAKVVGKELEGEKGKEKEKEVEVEVEEVKKEEIVEGTEEKMVLKVEEVQVEETKPSLSSSTIDEIPSEPTLTIPKPPSSPSKPSNDNDNDDMSIDTIPTSDLDLISEPASSIAGESTPSSPKKKLSKKQKKAEAAAKRAATLKAKEEEEAAAAAAISGGAKEEEMEKEKEEKKEVEEKKKDGKHKRDEDEDEEKADVTKKAKADTGDPIVLAPIAVAVKEKEKEIKIPTGPAADKDSPSKSSAPSNRENSRLRIYFCSPVSSVSTYQIQPTTITTASIRESSVASTMDSTIKVEEEGKSAEVAIAEPILEEGNEEDLDGVDVDGEPVDGETVDGEPVEIVETATVPVEESEDGDADGDAAAIESALVSGTSVAPEEAVTTETEIINVDNASYPPNPYSQPEPSPAPPSHHIEDNLPPEPAADRISISYARNTRRMVLDADVVESVKICRAEGKIEMVVLVKPAYLGTDESVVDEFRICKGILVEALDPEADNFIVMDRTSLDLAHRPLAEDLSNEADLDSLLPPLHHLLVDTASAALSGEGVTVAPSPYSRDRITIVATLDRSNPLTEARWVKTGEVDAWISAIGQEPKEPAKEVLESEWKGKITVADPDPPPTIQHALESWASSNSVVGTRSDREKFVAGHMSDIDNVFEILLRLTRGDRAGPSHYTASTQPSAVGALAASLHAPYAEHQTQVSLAVLAMFRLSMETAVKAGIPKKEMEKQIGEIIRTIPWHLLFKSLDGIFKEFLKGEKGDKGESGSSKKRRD